MNTEVAETITSITAASQIPYMCNNTRLTSLEHASKTATSRAAYHNKKENIKSDIKDMVSNRQKAKLQKQLKLLDSE